MQAMTAAVFRYQYAGKTSGPRYEAWREEFGRKWISADFEPIRDDYIASEIMGSQLSFVTLGCVRGMPLHTDRRNDIGQTGQGQLFLVLASGCSIRASQRGKSIDLARGDLTLMSGNEPARLTQFTEGSRWSVRIPHRRDQGRDIAKSRKLGSGTYDHCRQSRVEHPLHPASV